MGMKRALLPIFALIVIILSFSAVAYKDSVHVKIEDDYFYEYDPKVIEGKEITNDEGNCIYVKESEWVIIRNNHLHDCKATGNRAYNGFAIYIEDVEHVVIEGNLIEDNYRGIYLKDVKHVTIKNNNQTGTHRDAVIKIVNGEDIKIYSNLLEDNGVSGDKILTLPETIGTPDGKTSGIELWQADDVTVYKNVILNSAQHGISVKGPTKNDLAARSYNLTVYNNTIMTNKGHGLLLEGVQEGEVYDNHIARNAYAGESSGILLDYDVKEIDIHDNQIEKHEACGVLIRNSPSNFVYNNVILNNDEGGVCLDGETVSSEGYRRVGNRKNQIHRNTFRSNTPPVQIISGENDGTEFFYNTFDTFEGDAISSDKAEWTTELVLTGNTFKQEEKAEVKTETETETKDESPKQETKKEPVAEEVTQKDAGSTILLVYAFLTLFFVILVVSVILFSVRKKSKKKTSKRNK
jgi:parallel beta-helix repeat protein